MKNTIFANQLVRLSVLCVALVGVTSMACAITYPSQSKENGNGAMPVFERQGAPSQGSSMRVSTMQTSGSAYSSSVYVPFSGESPSMESDPTATPQGRQLRKGFIDGPDTPPADQSPVGEPWILVAFAALFAGAIAWRKNEKRRAQDVDFQ